MVTVFFLVKSIAVSGLLYGYYFAFLRNKRFHRYNRFYLLAIAVFSLIIPLLHIPLQLFGGNPRQSTLLKTLRVMNAAGWEDPVTVYASPTLWHRWVTPASALYALYFAGVAVGTLLLFRALRWIHHIRQKYPFSTIGAIRIYRVNEPGTPFSFFKSIFWDSQTSLQTTQGQQMLRHELFHVKEQHSGDILFLEILCCIAWINPFYHLIKKELKAIHEFLADEFAASASNRYEYAELLVLQAMQHKLPAITHAFFHNQIKRRITMITQSNLVRRTGYLSRIMALPLLLVLVSAFAVKLTGKSPGNAAGQFATKNITVVIDPGHGGIFSGADGGGGIIEKNINLQIGQKIKALGAGYNVTVILTRSSDATVGNVTDVKQDLFNRTKITEDAKADVFISLHVNAIDKTMPGGSGFEAYISKRTENAKSKQLASSVLSSLKEIYAVNEVIKERNTGVQVLDKASCPAVLLECGYITNPTDVQFITNSAIQEKVARKILEGVVQYSNSLAMNVTGTDMYASSAGADTISAKELSELNTADIHSIHADLKKNIGKILFQNGDVKLFNPMEVNEYYATHNVKEIPKNNLLHLNIKDSLEDIFFKISDIDTLPAHRSGRGITFTKVENEAQFPMGQVGWSAYLFKSIRYPQVAQDKEIQGTVIVQFIVDEKGKVSNIKALSGPQELRAESIRVIKESGTWTSAMQNGKKVKSYKKQPITYKLEQQG